jgi:uncharacterized protein (TIGR02285 family)
MTTKPKKSFKLLRHAVACMSLIASCLACAQEKPVMHWLQVHQPPITILVNEQPTNGIADDQLRLITAQWPEVTHKFIGAQPSRILKDLAEPDANACANQSIVTPEREKRFYQTITGLSPSVIVVAKPQVLRTMPKNAKGEVLPGALFNRSDLTGITNPRRSYSPVIDTLIARRSPVAKIAEITPWNGGANVLEMIASDRADYTLEFEPLLTYMTATVPNLKNSRLASAPIAGGVINKLSIICPRNAWGYATIQKIDAIVTALASNPEFQQPNSIWISKSERMRMKTPTDEFYKARAKPTPPDRYTPP